MVALFPPQTVLTQAGAGNDLQADNLDALGLTTPAISPTWAGTNPAQGDVDLAQMTIQLNNAMAPWRCVVEYLAAPVDFAGVSGQSLGGPALVARLHPEAARRLERSVALRHGSTARPVPVAMVLRLAALPAGPPNLRLHRAGETLEGGGGQRLASFHDARGLIIDPVAVAQMLLDLVGARPALLSPFPGGQGLGGVGGLQGIAALAPPATRIHVIDPHGWVFNPPRPLAQIKLIDGGGAQQAVVPASGLVDLPAGQSLGRANADTANDPGQPLRWGLAGDGVMGRLPLAAPAFPGGITRQFIRVMAVDLDWHLLGNRSNGTVNNVRGDDGQIPAFLLPVVRPAVPNFNWLADGMDVLGAATAIAQTIPAPAVWAIIASPEIDPALATPPNGRRWPGFPTPLGAVGGFTPGLDPRRNLAAAWRNPADRPGAVQDVVLTVAADTVPAEAHIRAYPRSFQEIRAIGEDPSFLRGDGGAGIARPGQPAPIVIPNPFGLAPGDPHPANARLSVDLVVTTRLGLRRVYSLATVPVAAGPLAFAGLPEAPFGGVAPLQNPLVVALLDGLGQRSIAPSSLFGIASPPPLGGGPPASVAAFLRSLASETQPRIGPRLPTQGRHETIWAVGTAPAQNQALAFRALLTGARWTQESRSANPELADPGNPPGPDIHAAGVSVDGPLAYDLAVHALKRAQPILPLGPGQQGWLVSMGGDNWDPPAAPVAGTVSAVMLETIAAICDTPELSFLPTPQPGDTIGAIQNAITNALGLAPQPPPAPSNADRILVEVQREIATSKFGRRDAQWALTRAFAEARELVYIEGPAFAATARQPDPPAAAVPFGPSAYDLVAALLAALNARPGLRVIICVPRMPEFAVQKAPWVRAALAHRKAAIESLTDVHPSRVAAFHPAGFPGRAALIRSTSVIVDDAWCMVGTSHIRRRGMTFDGGVDVASFDRQVAAGYSAGIAAFRRALMAAKLGVPVPGGPAQASALWTRLARPASAFDAVADLLAEGGLGRIQPIWAGPTDSQVIPQKGEVADPDGSGGADFLTLFAGLISEI